MENSKQPAFGYGFITADGQSHVHASGLTKREYFAGLAMQGHLANSAENDITTSYVLKRLGLPSETKYEPKIHYPQYVAKLSAEYSDALLNELEKPQP